MGDLVREEVPLQEVRRAEALAALRATARDGVEVTIWFEYGYHTPGGVDCEIIAVCNGTKASSVVTSDWPQLERYVPRREWPPMIWAGTRGPSPDERRMDEAVADLLRRTQERVVRGELASCGLLPEVWASLGDIDRMQLSPRQVEHLGCLAAVDPDEVLPRFDGDLHAVVVEAAMWIIRGGPLCRLSLEAECLLSEAEVI